MAGNRDAQSHALCKLNQNNCKQNSPGTLFSWRHSLFRASHGLMLVEEGEYKLYHSVWEPPIICLAWKISSSHSCCVDNKSMSLKMLFNLYFKTELWHIYKSLLPSAKGLSIYFYVESSPFLLKSTRWRAHCRLHSLLLVYIGYDLTGSLLPWIIMFSQSLIFKGALHLCFAVSERASEIPFCYIIFWLFWESVVIRDLLLWLASWLCHWYE